MHRLQKYFTIFNASALKLGASLMRAIHPNAYAYDEKLVSNIERCMNNKQTD